MTDTQRNTLFPTTENIRIQLNNIALRGKLDLLVVVFCGHGYAKNPNQRYLFGILSNKDQLDETALPVSELIAQLKAVNAVNTILIIDSCRNELQEGLGLSGQPMLEGEQEVLSRCIAINPNAVKQPDYQTSTFAILNSCSEKEFAYESPVYAHGLFSGILLQGMDHRFKHLSKLMEYVQPKVSLDAFTQLGQNQHPYYEIQGSGDIVLLTEPINDTDDPFIDNDYRTEQMITRAKNLEALEQLRIVICEFHVLLDETSRFHKSSSELMYIFKKSVQKINELGVQEYFFNASMQFSNLYSCNTESIEQKIIEIAEQLACELQEYQFKNKRPYSGWWRSDSWDRWLEVYYSHPLKRRLLSCVEKFT